MTRRGLITHILGPGGLEMRTPFEAGHRYVAIPQQCQDCTAEPVTAEPPDGFAAHVVFRHDATCPLWPQRLRYQGAGGL
jgi:hypothetical protein